MIEDETGTTGDNARPEGTAPPAELVIRLAKPIMHGGENGVCVEYLTLREPTAGEYAGWDKLTGVEADTMAISLVAGVDQSVVRKLNISDFLRATEYLGSFFRTAQRTPAN